MKIQLHEIELGSGDLNKSKAFYQTLLGVHPNVDQPHLKVFSQSEGSLDFNCATHHPKGQMVISFITDDLQEAMRRLQSMGISYTNPSDAHLQMKFIECCDPDGYKVRINQKSKEV